jgi:hypothetical protein
VTILLLTVVAAGGCVAGLVSLWRRRGAHVLTLSIAALVALTICAFSADIWFDWFGFARGDGEIFIGYYLFGLFAVGAAALALAAALIVIALRPRVSGVQA